MPGDLRNCATLALALQLDGCRCWASCCYQASQLRYKYMYICKCVQVAIKKVLQDKRFKNRELQIIRIMEHPNVVMLKYNFFSVTERDERFLHLVLEFIPSTVYKCASAYRLSEDSAYSKSTVHTSTQNKFQQHCDMQSMQGFHTFRQKYAHGACEAVWVSDLQSDGIHPCAWGLSPRHQAAESSSGPRIARSQTM